MHHLLRSLVNKPRIVLGFHKSTQQVVCHSGALSSNNEPCVENILSTGAEEAGTERICKAIFERGPLLPLQYEEDPCHVAVSLLMPYEHQTCFSSPILLLVDCHIRKNQMHNPV